MTDNADDSGKQELAEARAGQRLANARRANDISMGDIAKELHLDEVKVQALEDNRFEVLGAPVFAKGYLRKYAELVNVPIDDVLADYYKMNRAAGAPPVVGPRRRKPPRDFAPGPWFAGIVILVIAAGATYWWLNRDVAPSRSAMTQTTPVAAKTQDVAQDAVPGVDVESPAISQPGTAETDDQVPAAASTDHDGQREIETTQARQSVSGAAAAGERQVQLRFSGDCWTEVTDADGRRLFFGLGSDGRVVTVSGVPPLRLLLGNNDNVSVLVDGEIHVVSESELRGNTARLTIGAL